MCGLLSTPSRKDRVSGDPGLGNGRVGFSFLVRTISKNRLGPDT